MRDDQIHAMFKQLLDYYGAHFCTEKEEYLYLQALILVYKQKPKDYE